MDINKDQQELIDQFLRNELKGDKLDEFLKKIEKEPAMKEVLQLQQEMAQGIEHYGNKKLRERFRKISQEVSKQPKEPSRIRRRPALMRYALVAAAVLTGLVIVSVLFLQDESPQQLFSQFYEPTSLTISRNADIDATLAQAERFYNNKNYAAAIPVLQTLLKSQTQNSKLQLALGNAFLNTGKLTEARLEFQNILERKDPLFSDQAKWFLALTYLKSEDLVNSKKLLEELAENADADFHQEAKALLDKL